MPVWLGQPESIRSQRATLACMQFSMLHSHAPRLAMLFAPYSYLEKAYRSFDVT